MNDIEWSELYEFFCEVKEKQDEIIIRPSKIIQRLSETLELYTKDDELYSDAKLKEDKNIPNEVITEYEYLVRP